MNLDYCSADSFSLPLYFICYPIKMWRRDKRSGVGKSMLSLKEYETDLAWEGLHIPAVRMTDPSQISWPADHALLF
jgi:hypothetical protein